MLKSPANGTHPRPAEDAGGLPRLRIEVLYVDGCPNYRRAAERVRTILKQEGLTADVEEVDVKDESAAKALAFPGSPTIRINGVDVEPAARNTGDIGYACRRYPGGGAPPEEMIRTALREARVR
jgi:hypothetical protein